MAISKIETNSLGSTTAIHSDSTLALQTNGTTTAITIDSSQNVGIGTSPVIASAAGSSLTLAGAYSTGGAITAHQTNKGILQYLNNDTTIRSYGATAGTGAIVFNTGGGGGSADTERMRIDPNGMVLIADSNDVNYPGRLFVKANPTSNIGITTRQLNNNSNAMVFIGSAGSIAGNIYISGTTATYSSVSDYRLKENVAPMTGALNKVAKLKPVTYTWKADGSDGQGFIAHELQSVVPDCVVGEKDAVNEDGSIKAQSIDTSFLVATLTAAIQELKAELDATKAEVAALKGTK